jgi:excisionase family DNA binding protein
MARSELILLTPPEVASLARVSLKTVYRALWSGELEGKRVRRRWRIPEDAVWRWIGVEAA